MYKNILVPLDGSDLAELALHEAFNIVDCNKEESKITIFMVNEIYPITAEDRKIEIDHLYTKSQKYLETVEQRVREKGYNVVTEIKNGGNPAVEICRYAEKNDIHIVVIASHGIGGILHWAIGSHADKVIRHCSKPVLIRSCCECKMEI